MKCPFPAMVAAVVISSSVQAQDEIVLQRLTTPPESIEETFYRFDKNEAVIKGSVIQKVTIDYEAGKGGGRLKIEYKNNTNAEVTPRFVLRLYNPFGICMGGVWVSEENMNAHDSIAPGDSGVTHHTFWIFQVEAYIRHGIKGKLPDDFASLGWISISESNTILVEKPPKKKKILKFELLNEE